MWLFKAQRGNSEWENTCIQMGRLLNRRKQTSLFKHAHTRAHKHNGVSMRPDNGFRHNYLPEDPVHWLAFSIHVWGDSPGDSISTLNEVQNKPVADGTMPQLHRFSPGCPEDSAAAMCLQWQLCSNDQMNQQHQSGTISLKVGKGNMRWQAGGSGKDHTLVQIKVIYKMFF